MPSKKSKTHKGAKKRFKVSATGKVSHKRCGSSHLMSHKSGKQVRRLRKKKVLSVAAEAHRLRRALQQRESAVPSEARREAEAGEPVAVAAGTGPESAAAPSEQG